MSTKPGQAHTTEAKEKLALELEKARLQIAEDSKKTAFADVAMDVAHNIRSPLAALELKLNEVTVLPSERSAELRDAVHRIRDVANQLVLLGQKARLAKEKIGTRPEIPIQKEPLSDELIPTLVDSIVSEKRIEYRPRLDLRIDYRFTSESYGLFAKIQPTEFRCSLSNLINNAIEACGKAGRVEVVVRPGRETGVVEIVVRDNGCGVSEEVLARLGERGLSVGKPGGSGLGLAHAKESVERWGGRLMLSPRDGGGTEARIILPRVPAPGWFARELSLPPGIPVVVVDDDASVHQLWHSRVSGHDITHVSGPAELSACLALAGARASVPWAYPRSLPGAGGPLASGDENRDSPAFG